MQSGKSKLRELFKKQRSAMSQEDVIKKSSEINQNFVENLLPKICKQNSEEIFSLYLSSGNEVRTQRLSEHFKKNNFSFSYPRIITKNHPLEFVLAEENQTLVKNQFYPKILEPLGGKVVLPNFLILPLVAFDDDLSRLGMGGGFFDRTISELRKQKFKIITIGLGYDFQRSRELLPTENTDCRLDFIVTEQNIFSANQSQS